MRSAIVRMVGLCLLAAGCADAASSAKKIADKTGSAMKDVAAATKAEFLELKDAFKKKMDEHLGGYDKKLDDLKAKAKDAQGDAKVKLDEQVKTGESLLAKAKEQMGKLGEAGKEHWEAFEKTMVDLMEQLKKTLG
jgi:hypothetical protein